MAGIGIQADRHALIDGQEAVFLAVSDVAERDRRRSYPACLRG